MKEILLIAESKEYVAKVDSFVGEILSIKVEQPIEFGESQVVQYSFEGKKEQVRILRQEGNNILLYVPYNSSNILGERRRFPRYNLKLCVEITSLSGETYNILTSNIGIYGAGLVSNTALTPGDYRFELTGLDISGKLKLSNYGNSNYGGEFFGLSRMSIFELRRILLNRQLDLLSTIS
jgi:hypothetical protein